MELTFSQFTLALVFHNIPIFMLLIGLLIIFFSHKNSLTKEQNRTFLIATIALSFLTIVDALEIFFGNEYIFTSKNIGRTIFSMLGYGLRPLLILAVTNLTIKDWKTKFIIWSPSLLMFIISIISIWTGWICWYDDTNIYHEGPLHFLVLVICFVNIAILIWSLFPLLRRKRYEEILFVSFVTLCIIVGTVLDIVIEGGFFFKLADVGGCIGLSFLYIYLYIITTRRDQLTQLYNRQSFYNDIEKYGKSISAIISIDMNGLKTINDTYGHAAGDVALSTIAKAFDQTSNKRATPYRIGGDEFVFICSRMDEMEVKEMMKKLQIAISQTNYFCAFGYSMVKDNQIDDAMRDADAKMYEEKRKFKLKEEQLAKMKVEGTRE